jgi:hypothetical protein
MTIALDNGQIRFLRQYAQHLIPDEPGTYIGVARVVKETCGIQAQDAVAAALAIRVRSTGLVAPDVEQARVHDRSVVRTWGPRGTLHLLATEDLGWLLSLLGPIFIAGNRSRRVELGLDDQTTARGAQLIRNILAAHGPLTRDELVEQLAVRGMHLEGQSRPHLIAYAALQGILCLGPDRGAKPTYVLLDDWLGRAALTSLPREAACEELARRYLSAYGPASPADMAAWSGLPMSEVRTAWTRITGALLEVQVAGQPAWMPKSHLAGLDDFPNHPHIVRLLAAFDTYLLGYRNRDLAVAPQHAKRINAGGGIVRPALLINGQALGSWKSTLKKKQLAVVVEPFGHLLPDVRPALEADAADIARFLRLSAVEVSYLI